MRSSPGVKDGRQTLHFVGSDGAFKCVRRVAPVPDAAHVVPTFNEKRIKKRIAALGVATLLFDDIAEGYETVAPPPITSTDSGPCDRVRG